MSAPTYPPPPRRRPGCPACGAPHVRPVADLDGRSLLVVPDPAGDLTVVARVVGESIMRVARYHAEEDDGTDARFREHRCPPRGVR